MTGKIVGSGHRHTVIVYIYTDINTNLKFVFISVFYTCSLQVCILGAKG